MLKRLRNLPLAIKLWIVFSCFTIPLIILLSVVFSNLLAYSRDEVIYSSIEKAQQLLMQDNASVSGSDKGGIVPKDYDAIISVYHIGIVNRQVKYMTFPTSKFSGYSTQFINTMGTSYSEQKISLKKYKLNSSGYNLYYIIEKNGGDGVISFRVDSSNEQVYNISVLIISCFSAGAVLLTLLFAFLFARSIAKPLKKLEKAASHMAAGDFETPVGLERKDEIGRLSHEIDTARIELQRRDILRQSAIQYVSHELKTPVMTISSYAQSILDKVYPRGDLEGSVKVISSQAERLQRTILKLLTITRLDYLDSKSPQPQLFDLAETIEDISERLCFAKQGVDVRLDLDNTMINGLKEQIEVLAENLLENAVRYAQSKIRISVENSDIAATLKVYNDGGGIDEALLPQLFDVFVKGSKGVTGLGLTIVKRTADTCGAEIKFTNIDDGVQIEVKFKKNADR